MEQDRAGTAAPAVPPAPGRPRTGLRLAAALTVTGAAAALIWADRWANQPATGVLNAAVACSFVATAVVVAADADQRATACDLTAAAALYLLSWGWAWPAVLHASPQPLLSFVLGYLWFVALGAALLRYPQPRLRRSDRLALVGAASWIVGTKALAAVVSRPGWDNYADVAWWPTFAPDRPLFDALSVVSHVGIAVVVAVLLGLFARKVAAAGALDRIDALPAAVAALASAVCGVPDLATRVLDVPAARDVLRVATAVAALGTPLAFLVIAVRRHLLRVAVLDALPRFYAATSLPQLQDELRRALRDPGAELLLTDAIPADSSGPVVHLRGGDGRELGIVILSPPLLRHRRTVESAVQGVGPALDRIQQRPLLAADAERAARRRIARDLHDGAQQVLLAALLRLAVAQRRADPDTTAEIDRARTAVGDALGLIRTLAAGDVPLQRGLAAALDDLAAGSAVPTRVRLAVARVPSELHRPVWFVVAEGLANVTKHAAATAAEVEVTARPGELVVRVLDDGRGGARADGSGLGGLARRVAEAGGRLDVTSPPGAGTVLEARFPCGS